MLPLSPLLLVIFLYFRPPMHLYFALLDPAKEFIVLSFLTSKDSTLYFVFCSLSMESQEWQMLRVSFHVQRKEILQMHHRLGVDALVRNNFKLWQGRQVGKLPSKYVLCSCSYYFQLQLPRCSRSVFRDCFNSESLSRENIILVGMKNEPNPALWLATRAGKMELSCPLGTTRCIPQEKFPRKPYNESFIDQACLVKMAGYWHRSFLASLRTSTPSLSTSDTLGQ